MSKGGLIVFDEGNLDLKKSGESRALKEFLIDNRKNFKKIFKKTSTRCLFRKNQINENNMIKWAKDLYPCVDH